MEDEIDRIVAQWRQVRPDLDPSPSYTLQRIVRADLLQIVSFNEVFAHFGVTWGEYLVLAALRRGGPPYRMNPTTLFNEVILSSGAMTNRLDRLEAVGLVRRLADPNDRRGRLVELTVKGREVVDEAATAYVANQERLLSGMSATDRTKLAELLRKLLLSEPFRALDPLSRAPANAKPRSLTRKAELAKRGNASSGARKRASK